MSTLSCNRSTETFKNGCTTTYICVCWTILWSYISSTLCTCITLQDFGGVTARVAALREEIAVQPNASVLQKRVAEVMPSNMAMHVLPGPSTHSQPVCSVSNEWKMVTIGMLPLHRSCVLGREQHWKRSVPHNHIAGLCQAWHAWVECSCC